MHQIQGGCYLFAEFDPLWGGGRRSEGVGPITSQDLSSLRTSQTLKREEEEETDSVTRAQHQQEKEKTGPEKQKEEEEEGKGGR